MVQVDNPSLSGGGGGNLMALLRDTKQKCFTLHILFVILLCTLRRIQTQNPCFRLLIQYDSIRTELYRDLIVGRPQG